MINPKTCVTFVRKVLISYPGLIVMALLLPKVPVIAKGIYKSLKKNLMSQINPWDPGNPCVHLFLWILTMKQRKQRK